MITEIVSMHGNPYKIWYENPLDRMNAINEINKLNEINEKINEIKSLQTNLLLNPGFDTGATVPDNWWSYKTTGSTMTFLANEVGRLGTGRSVSIVGPTAAETTNTAIWAQTVTVAPSTSYTLNGYIKTANLASPQARFTIDWYSTAGYISSSYQTPSISGTTAWTSYQLTATSPTNAVSAHVAGQLVGTSPGGQVWFDDMSFTTPTVTKYDCVNGTCQPGTTYPDLATCQASCAAVTKYTCQNKICTPSATGEFVDLATCKASACETSVSTCPGCDLTTNYCLMGTCIPKIALYGGVGVVGVLLLFAALK